MSDNNDIFKQNFEDLINSVGAKSATPTSNDAKPAAPDQTDNYKVDIWGDDAPSTPQPTSQPKPSTNADEQPAQVWGGGSAKKTAPTQPTEDAPKSAATDPWSTPGDIWGTTDTSSVSTSEKSASSASASSEGTSEKSASSESTSEKSASSASASSESASSESASSESTSEKSASSESTSEKSASSDSASSASAKPKRKAGRAKTTRKRKTTKSKTTKDDSMDEPTITASVQVNAKIYDLLSADEITELETKHAASLKADIEAQAKANFAELMKSL